MMLYPAMNKLKSHIPNRYMLVNVVALRARQIADDAEEAGVQLDEDQKVTPYEAMRAITYNGAYQYGEEADKGTLEAGKLADLVVLDRNPLAVDPREIRDIQVLATIKEGETLYERDAK